MYGEYVCVSWLVYCCLVLLHWLNVWLDLVDNFFHALSQHDRMGAYSSEVWLMAGANFLKYFNSIIYYCQLSFLEGEVNLFFFMS